MPGVDNSAILQGRAALERLGEPIGIAPDFALLCDVEGYDEQGYIVLRRSKTLRLTFTLYDLQEKKAVWTSTSEALAVKSLLGSVLAGGLPELLAPDDFKIVSAAFLKAIASMPAVNGFQHGPASGY